MAIGITLQQNTKTSRGGLSRTAKAGFLGVANSASAISGILIASVLSYLLTKTEYATYRQTLLTFQMVAPLLALGLPTAVLYFIPRNPERCAATALEMFLLMFVTGSTFAAFMLFGGAEWVAIQFNNPKLETSLKWFSCYGIFALMLMLVGPILVAQNASSWVALHSLLVAALKVLVVVLPVWLIQRNSLFAIQGSIVWGVAAVAISFLFLFSLMPKLESTPNLDSIKEICGYGIPLSLAGVIATLNKNVDKALVSKFLEPDEAAVFLNGAIEVPFIGIVVGSVTSILAAEFTAKFEHGKIEEIMSVWQSAVRKTAAVLLPIGIFLYIFAEFVLIHLFSSEYADSAIPFRIYLYLLPLRVFQGGVFLRMAGKTKELLGFSIAVTICNVGLTYMFVPAFGMNGAAYATVLSVGLFGFALGIWLTDKSIGLNMWKWIPWKGLVLIFAMSLGFISFASFLFDTVGLSDVSSFVMSLLVVAGLILFILRHDRKIQLVS